MANSNSGSEDPGSKSFPSILLAILALFGLSTMRGSVATDPASLATADEEIGPDAPQPMVSPSADPSSEFAEEAEIMKPLLDHFRVRTDDRKGLKATEDRTSYDQDRPLYCLIATVPDPVRSTNSHRYDEWIGSIRRGCESEHFVLDGFRIPWAPPATTAGAANSRVAAPAVDGRQPGLMLFRFLADSENGERKRKPLLAVFLVPETPTLGLDKGAMLQSLDLAAKWDLRNRRSSEVTSFNILGPTFSGSQDSLEEVLRARCRPGRSAQQFDVITGGATAIDMASLAKNVSSPHSLRFSSTMHMNIALVFSMLDCIGQDGDTAILAESDTGFGQILQNSKPEKTSGTLVYYPFPLHVSKLRGTYERKGYLRDSQAQTIPSAERLTIPFDEAGNPSDIVGTQTPGFTTAVEELVLNQILMDIDRRGIRKVGITATDPLDVVFLARQVRRFCPDVLIFTTQSHLLFTHPQHIAELRGMLTASTYPLYPLNQLWSYSYRGDTTHSYFSGDSVQGTYNAAVALLDRMQVNPDVPPRFLEYGNPFDTPVILTADGQKRRPPIWISVVGNHGIYPLKTFTDPPQRKLTKDDSQYVFQHDQPRTELKDLQPTQKDGPQLRERILGWFRPLSEHFWFFLFVILSMACLALASVQWIVLHWDFRESLSAAPRPALQTRGTLARLAEFLNCRRALDAVDDFPCRGPGPFLFALLIVFAIIYLMVCWPLLEVMWRIRWIPIRFGYRSSWIIWIVYAVLSLLLVSAIVGLFIRLIPLRNAVQPAETSSRTFRSRGERLKEHVHWLVIIAALALGGIVLSVQALLRVGENFDFGASDDRRAGLFRLAREMAIPSGVSPVLALVFLGIAWLAWSYAQLNRRFLFDQYTPKHGPPVPEAEVSSLESGQATGRRVDEPTFQAIYGLRNRFEEILASPRRLILHSNPGALVLALICGGYLLVPVFLDSVTRHAVLLGEPFFEIVSATLFFVLFVLLAFHAIQLIMLWNNINALMRVVIQLPLATTLDRMPARVAKWFTQPPKPGSGRFDLIRRQAFALAEFTERANLDVDLAKGLNLPPATLATLTGDLKQLQERSLGTVPEQIREILQDQWASLPVTVAYAQEEVPKASSTPEAPPQVQLWLRQAEDLLALFFMRWLSASLAQVWNLMKFLVIASLAMLLAVSSFPFSFQDRLMLRLGLLIGVLVVMILVIVLGFNRNEVISRISNTSPNRFKIDQNLVGAIFTYVVPLLGVLAALSLDGSDTIRSLLDPITRHMK
jgi:hypothetical protein